MLCKRSFLLLLIIIVAFSCRKKGADYNNHYSTALVNNSLQKLNVNIYKNYTDYCNNRNVFIQEVMESNTNTTITNMLVPGTNYYMDVYGDDRVHTNWGLLTNRPPFSILITTGVDIKLADALDSTYKRKIFLNGGDSVRTVWKAVDAYTNHQSILVSGASVWGQLSAAQQDKQLIVTKGYNAVYTYVNDTGGNTNDTSGLVPNDAAYMGFDMYPIGKRDTLTFNYTGQQKGYVYSYYQSPYNQAYGDMDKVVCHFTSRDEDTSIIYIMQKQ